MASQHPAQRAAEAAADLREAFPPNAVFAGFRPFTDAVEAICRDHGGEIFSFFPLVTPRPETTDSTLHTMHAGWFEERGEPDAFLVALLNMTTSTFDIYDSSDSAAWPTWIDAIMRVALIQQRHIQSGFGLLSEGHKTLQ